MSWRCSAYLEMWMNQRNQNALLAVTGLKSRFTYPVLHAQLGPNPQLITRSHGSTHSFKRISPSQQISQIRLQKSLSVQHHPIRTPLLSISPFTTFKHHELYNHFKSSRSILFLNFPVNRKFVPLCRGGNLDGNYLIGNIRISG